MSDSLVVESEEGRVPLKQYFGITESYDTGYGKDVDYINSWGKNKGLKIEDMLLEIKKVEQRLGSPMPGENRLHRVKHYLSLDEKLTNTLKEMSAHERSWKELT
jgi:hypothetical protein